LSSPFEDREPSGGLDVRHVHVKNVLTRTTGFLRTVTSHSLQPYRGCTFGSSLCGVGCYVQHNTWLTRGRAWGRFLEVRTNAAASYRQRQQTERRWARKRLGRFSIFMSSSTEPFLPQENQYGVTSSVLQAMREAPPDELVVQTHTHRVTRALPQLSALAAQCALRVHVSIESDRESFPGLPPPASPVSRRFDAVQALRERGIFVVVTVAPLLPLADPEAFFDRIAHSADACVLDHFVGGDGSADGGRTHRTRLPQAMESVHPGSTDVAYRDRMLEIARAKMPGRVGVNIDGFAGRYLE
jgi:DNA repair photolyase